MAVKTQGIKLSGFSKKPISEQESLITELFQAVTHPNLEQLKAQYDNSGKTIESLNLLYNDGSECSHTKGLSKIRDDIKRRIEA
jgi:hypothetical protein